MNKQRKQAWLWAQGDIYRACHKTDQPAVKINDRIYIYQLTTNTDTDVEKQEEESDDDDKEE